MLYQIAGLQIEYDAVYDLLRQRSEQYIAKETKPVSNMIFDLKDEIYQQYSEFADEANRPLIEYMHAGRLFYHTLLHFDGILLHSSAVALDGKAYLFSADSGVGKSTHTNLWLEHFKGRATILNDDKPALRLIDGKLFAAGTPFSGKFDISQNLMLPVAGICFLHRSEINEIQPMQPKDAVMQFYRQTVHPHEEDMMDKMLAVMEQVLASVPLFALGCNISDEAVEVAYNAMKGE